MRRRVRHFCPEEQSKAVAQTQMAMWRGVVARFQHLKAVDGLRQADLAAALGVSRPQIHEWLSNPRNMTLKAAGRLLLAMDAQARVEVATEPEVKSTAGPGEKAEQGLSAGPPADPRHSGVLVALVVLVSSLLSALLDPAFAAIQPVRLVILDLPHEASTLSNLRIGRLRPDRLAAPKDPYG